MSPYGISKSLGGDSPTNVSKVERCVSHVQGSKNKRTGKSFTKEQAIAVCKAMLKKSKGGK